MHMIALSLKKKLNIKWIADFRDPWTDIEYFDHLPLLSLVRKKHQTLEKAKAQAYKLIKNIKCSNLFYRKDIGD